MKNTFKNKKIRKLFVPTKKSLISTIVVVAMLLIVAFVLKSTNLQFGDTGYAVVSSGSMQPVFPVGSLVKYRTDCTIDDVKQGDIIVFDVKFNDTGKKVRVFHRAMFIKNILGETRVKTKGDWNTSMDEWMVSKRGFVGIVTSDTHSTFDAMQYFTDSEINNRCAGVNYDESVKINQQELDKGKDGGYYALQD